MTLGLVNRAKDYSGRTAIVVDDNIYTYADLLRVSRIIATKLLTGRKNLNANRICILVPPGWDYVVSLWGIWRAGGVAVPMAILVATLMAFGRLSSDNEIAAMRSVSASYFKLMIPAMLLGCIIAGLMMYFNNQILLHK